MLAAPAATAADALNVFAVEGSKDDGYAVPARKIILDTAKAGFGGRELFFSRACYQVPDLGALRGELEFYFNPFARWLIVFG